MSLVTACVTVPGLLDTGLWTHLEFDAYYRVQAMLGEPVSRVLRGPTFPTWLQAQCVLATDVVESIRIPQAVAACLTAGFAAAITRLRGHPLVHALLVAGFVVGLPIFAASARLAAGHAVGEAFATMAVLLGVIGSRSKRLWAWLVPVGIAVFGASASMGIVLGGVLPLAAVGFVVTDRWPRRLVWGGAGVLAAAAGYLMYHQGNGYIPLLAAAKDFGFLESELHHNTTAGLADFGYQMFPWLPLAVAGLLFPGRDRWPAQWLLAGLGICCGWSLVYGRTALPLSVPTAMLCASGVLAILRHRSPHVRRLALVTAVGGLLIMGKDGSRTPRVVGDPLGQKNAHRYPDAELDAAAKLSRLSKVAGLCLVLVFALGGRGQSDRETRWERLQARFWWGPFAIAGGMLLHQAYRVHYDLIAAMGSHASPRKPLQVHASWARSGALPEALATPLDDPGVALYGPPKRHKLRGRLDTNRWLSGPDPAVALIPRSDLPHLVQQHRAADFPLFVLDHSHFHLALVSNRLPTGAVDQNPLAEVVMDEPPALAHTTLVRFEDALELVGWEIEGPVVRGRPFTIVLALRALKQLPQHTEIYTRLQEGRLSRINYLPVPITGKQYPPNLWRPGDIIVHRQTLDAPTLEIVTGEHDVVVALRRSKTSNFRISHPEQRETDDVTILDGGRHFASVGKVMVW